MFEIFVISLLRRLMIFFLNFINGIRAHVRYRAFATLQIELYCIVDYDSKWSTKFHKDCMFEFFNFTFKTSYDNKKKFTFKTSYDKKINFTFKTSYDIF